MQGVKFLAPTPPIDFDFPLKSLLLWVIVKAVTVKHCVKSVQIRRFFWSLFSRIWTEYGYLLRKSPYSVRVRENEDQKKLHIWTLFTQLNFFWVLFRLIVVHKCKIYLTTYATTQFTDGWWKEMLYFIKMFVLELFITKTNWIKSIKWEKSNPHLFISFFM